MVISREDFDKLIEVKADIEKITTLSSDGKNLLTRVPKEIRDFFKLEKKNKMRWLVNTKNQTIEAYFIKELEK